MVGPLAQAGRTYFPTTSYLTISIPYLSFSNGPPAAAAATSLSDVNNDGTTLIVTTLPIDLIKFLRLLPGGATFFNKRPVANKKSGTPPTVSSSRPKAGSRGGTEAELL